MPLQQTILVHGKTSYPHYYLRGYLPLSAKTSPLSLSLLKFKRGRQPDLKAWIGSSLETLPATLIPPDSILLRALHHDETFIREDTLTSLDKLGKALAGHFQSHFCPRSLRKSNPTREIKTLTKEQRAVELENCYYIDPRYIPHADPPSFLLIDDILTTGTTMQMIITAILRSFPKTHLTLFTLARADYAA